MDNFELIGVTTAEIMETIEAGDLPEDAEVAEVMVIVALVWSTDDPNELGESVYYRCTSARPWVQRGLLLETEKAIQRSQHDIDDEGEEDES